MTEELHCPHCGARMFATDEVCMTCGREREEQPVAREEGAGNGHAQPEECEAEQFGYAPPLRWIWLRAVLGLLWVVTLAILLATEVLQSQWGYTISPAVLAGVAGSYLACYAPSVLWPAIRWRLLARRGYVRLDGQGIRLGDHRGVETSVPWGGIRRLVAYGREAQDFGNRLTRFNPADASLEIGAFLERRPDLVHLIVTHAQLAGTGKHEKDVATVYSRPPGPGEEEALVTVRLVRRGLPLEWVGLAVSGVPVLLWLYAFLTSIALKAHWLLKVYTSTDGEGLFAPPPSSKGGMPAQPASVDWFVWLILATLWLIFGLGPFLLGRLITARARATAGEQTTAEAL